MRKILLGLFAAIVATCSEASAGTPTISVMSDTFARATTPTGATTGSYGPPNSSWGVGNGWYDLVGSPGSVPGTGWNIVGGQAVSTIVGKFAFLMQDPALTPTPNQRIVVTFPSISTANSSTYFTLVRGTYNTDSYAAVLSNTSFTITRLSGGIGTTNTISTASVTPIAGHTYSISLQATGDGSTTTALSAVATDVTASTTLSSLTGNDTTLELQSGGRVGLGTYESAAGSMPVSSVTIYSDQNLPFAYVPLAFIGDSLSYGLSTTLQTAPDLFARILNAQTLTKRYYPINLGFSGATTAQWVNGNSSGYMAALVTDMNAANCKTLFITLGSNDAIQGVTAATWLTNMQSIVAYLQAQIPGITIYFDAPPYLDWVRFSNAFGAGASAATLPLLRSYNYQALTANGVIVGDTFATQTFAQLNYQGLTDGGHPSDQGIPELAFLWLQAYLRNSNQIGPAPTANIQITGH